MREDGVAHHRLGDIWRVVALKVVVDGFGAAPHVVVSELRHVAVVLVIEHVVNLTERRQAAGEFGAQLLAAPRVAGGRARGDEAADALESDDGATVRCENVLRDVAVAVLWREGFDLCHIGLHSECMRATYRTHTREHDTAECGARGPKRLRAHVSTFDTQ